MGQATGARYALINRALECVVSERAEPSADSDAQNEYDEERLDSAAQDLVDALETDRQMKEKADG